MVAKNKKENIKTKEKINTIEFIKNASAEIVLRVDQSDIVDMIISEQEVRIQKEVDELYVIKKDLQENLRKIDIDDIGKKHINATKPDLIDSLKKIFGNVNLMTRRSEKTTEINIYSEQGPSIYPLMMMIGPFSRSEGYGGESFFKLTIKEKTSDLNYIKENAEYDELSKNIHDVEDRISKKKDELHRLLNTSKATKSALVKEILKTSIEGQQLLEKVERVSVNIENKLLDKQL